MAAEEQRKSDPPEARAVAGEPGAWPWLRERYFSFDRRLLGAGDEITGPAVVEELSSTLPLHPGFTARVDAYGNLVVRRCAS